VLGSRDEQLMTSYLVGSTGSQVSLAWVVPELVVGRWTAAEAGDWGRARAVHDKLNAVAKALYRDEPDGKARVRLKACLKLEALMRCGAAAAATGPAGRASCARACVARRRA
jgi:4-hydroxy-tetrahydrodipicolinate synthase